MAKRPDWRFIKVHRNYTVEEAATKIGVAKGTVLRWLKGGQLRAIMDKRPFLILGQDLIEFGRQSRQPKQTCALQECYCFTCRTPREPAARMADLTPIARTVGDLQAICGTCGNLMHKRVSLARKEALAALLDLTTRPAASPIGKCSQPRLNDHLRGKK